MTFLFETSVWLFGKSGSFEIYEVRNDEFFCKMMYWEAEQDQGPGDITLWKTKKKWKIDKNIYPNLKASLSSNIEKFLYSDRKRA